MFKGLTRLTVGLWATVMLISSVFVFSQAKANVFGEDRRRDLFPVPDFLQPIGVLRSIPDDQNWGTAFLVSECHIATAFHVAFPNHKEARFKPSTKMKSRFYVGRTGENRGVSGGEAFGFQTTSIAKPVAWGKFSSKDYRGLLGDWAVLELEDCLGRIYGSLSLTASLQSHIVRGSEISFAGFPRDRQDVLGITWEERCSIRDWGPGTLVGIDCGVRDGASGGPLLEKNEVPDGLGGVKTTYVVVGIAIRELRPRDQIIDVYHPSHRNIALLSEAFLSAVNRLPRMGY